MPARGADGSWEVHTQQPVKRDAKLQLAPEIDQADEDAFVRWGIRCTGRGIVTSAMVWVRKASHS